MKSEEILAKWRMNCPLMVAHEKVCQSEVDKYLDDLELPKTRSRWKSLLANAFDRGSCFGVCNFDLIKSKLENHNHIQVGKILNIKGVDMRCTNVSIKDSDCGQNTSLIYDFSVV